MRGLKGRMARGNHRFILPKSMLPRFVRAPIAKREATKSSARRQRLVRGRTRTHFKSADTTVPYKIISAATNSASTAYHRQPSIRVASHATIPEAATAEPRELRMSANDIGKPYSLGAAVEQGVWKH
jgi:hypothetical protein